MVNPICLAAYMVAGSTPSLSYLDPGGRRLTKFVSSRLFTIRHCRLITSTPASLDISSYPEATLIFMRAVGIKVLKNKLSEYVRLAQQGETMLVTDRDRVVAQLSPPQKSRSPMLADALLAEAIRQGWITPPSMQSEGPPPRSR